MKHKKAIIGFTVCLLSALAIRYLPNVRTTVDADTLDISNLEIETISEVFEPIHFDEAIDLDAKVSETLDRYAEENLKRMENEVWEATKNNVSYYRFTGTFSFSEIQDVQGVLTTLVMVVDDSEPYIYEIREPLTEVVCNQTAVQWTQMDSSAVIDAGKMSARIASMGYLTTTDENQFNQDSNTIYPAFTVSLF